MKLSTRIVLICILSSLIIIPAIYLSLRYSNRSTMSCIFCDIVANKTETQLVYEDEKFVAFRDIHPASKFHYLVIPRNHIPNVNSLTINDQKMIESMKKIMKDLLSKDGQTNESEVSMGFHLPPFNSIKHLHLHGIAPKSDMRFVSKWVFRENSYWYKTVDAVIESLPDQQSSL